MPFDVLVNLFTNVDKLRQDIASIRQQSIELERTQTIAARKMGSDQAKIDAQHQVVYKLFNTYTKQQIEGVTIIAKLEKAVADKRLEYAKAANFSAVATQKALAGQIPWIEAGVRKQLQSVQLAKQGQVILEKEIDIKRQLLEQYAAEHVAIEANRKAQQQGVRDQQLAMTSRQQFLRTQTIAAAGSRQQFAGAGFALASSGIPGMQTVGTAILAASFAPAPGAAVAWVGVASVLSGIVKLIGGSLDLFKTMVTTAFDFNQKLQQSQIAIAGIIAETSTLVDAQGNLIPEAEKFNAARKMAISLQSDLLKLIIRTNITLEEANTAIQSSIGFLTTRGVEAERAQNIIITLTALAKNLGFEGGRAARQVQAAITGTRARLTMLLQSAGISFREMASLSGNALAEMFESSTKFLRATIGETSNLLKIQIENVSDFFKTIWALAFGDAEKQLSSKMQASLNMFFTSKGEFTSAANEIREAAKSLFDEIARLVIQIAQPDTLKVVIVSFNTLVQVASTFLSVLKQIQGLMPFGGDKSPIVRVMREFILGMEVMRNFNLRTPAVEVSSYKEARRRGVSEEAALNVASLAGGMAARGALVGKKELDILINAVLLMAKAAEQIAKEVPAKIAAGQVEVVRPAELRGGTAEQDIRDLARIRKLLKMIREQEILAETPEMEANIAKIKALRKQWEETSDLVEKEHIIVETKVLQRRQQELRRAAGVDIQFQVPGAQSTEEARGVLERAEQMKQGRIDARKHEESMRAQLKLEIAAHEERISMLQDEIALGWVQLDLLSKEAGSEEAVNKAVRAGLIDRIDRADRAYRSAQVELAARQEYVRWLLANKGIDDDLLKARELERAAEEKLYSIIVAQVNIRKDSLSQLQQQYANIINQQDVLTKKIAEQTAGVTTKKGQALGISGASQAIIALGQERAKSEVQLAEDIKRLNILLSFMRRVEESARALPVGIGAGLASMAGAAVDNLLEQVDAVDKLKQRYLELYKIQLQMLQFQQALQDINDKQASKQADIANIQAEVANTTRSELSAYLAIRDINKQLAVLEAARQEILLSQFKYLELQKKELQFQLDNVSLAEEDQKEIKNTIVGIVGAQRNLNTQITKSITEAKRLQDPFTHIGSAIQKATSELAKFFDTIDMPLVSGLAKGIGAFTSGLQELLGTKESKTKPGKKLNILGQLGETFSEAKEAGGEGFLGSILGGLGVVSQVATIATTIAQGVMSVISMFSGIFSAAAKKMAKSIGDNITAINDAYSNGQTNLINTMNALEQERERTFALQQKKGGEEEAKKLRTELDNQLASLKKQQEDILTGFRFDLALQRLGVGFKEFATAIKEAAQKINDFLGAGGTVQDANEYLNNILKNFRDQLEISITQEQQTAIEQAQQLIDLNQQLLDLDNQHQQNVRNILSQGLVQRQLTFGQQKAQQLAAENAQYNKQHKQLLNQLDSAKIMFDINRQLLNTNLDVNNAEALRLELLNLQVAARKKEVNVIKEQADLLRGILTDQSGNFILSQELYDRLQSAGVFSGTGIKIGTITLNLIVNGTTVSGVRLAPELQQQIIQVVQDLLTSNQEELGLTSPNLQP